MRKELEKLDGERLTFSGTFERFGIKRGWKGKPLSTVLLRDVKNSAGEVVCEHLWLNMTKSMPALKMVQGDVIQFNARVTAYEKGYKGRREDVYDCPVELDYRLSFPTGFVKIETWSGYKSS